MRKRFLEYREWLALGDSIESLVTQSLVVMRELRRRNASGGERGYPSRSLGDANTHAVSDRTGQLAISTEKDPVREAQLRLEDVLLRFDKAINIPLSQAYELPGMHNIKMQGLAQLNRKKELRAGGRNRSAVHYAKSKGRQ